MNENKFSRHIPTIVALLGAIILIAAFFLPYAASNGDYGEWLRDYPDGMYAEEIGMTNSDAIGISPFEFLRIYIYGASNYSGDLQAISIICIVVIILIALFTSLCTLFAALRKAVPLIVFDVLTFSVFLLMNFDFTDRGVIKNDNYDFGAAFYLYFIGAAVTLAGAIWLLIAKSKAKKSNAVS